MVCAHFGYLMSRPLSQILFGEDVALDCWATPANSLILTPDPSLFLSLQPITTS